MDSKQEKIHTLLSEYHSLLNAGEPYGALLKLGRADFLLENKPSPERATFAKELEDIRLSTDEWERIRTKAEAEARRLLRILGSSGTLVIEEIYLIVSLRINLALVSGLVSRYWHFNLGLPMDEIDTEIRQLRTMPKMNAL